MCCKGKAEGEQIRRKTLLPINRWTAVLYRRGRDHIRFKKRRKGQRRRRQQRSVRSMNINVNRRLSVSVKVNECEEKGKKRDNRAKKVENGARWGVENRK